MPVTSYIRSTASGSIIARDEMGEYECRDGDSLDFGNGVVVTVSGPSQLGGGSWWTAAVGLVIGFAALVVMGVWNG